MNRRTACGLTLWAVGLLCAHCLAQQPPVPTKPAPDANGAEAAKPAIDPIAEAREELRAAETAHPGNTEEVANALNKLVGIEIGERKDPEESAGERSGSAVLSQARNKTSTKFTRMLNI